MDTNTDRMEFDYTIHGHQLRAAFAILVFEGEDFRRTAARAFLAACYSGMRIPFESLDLRGLTAEEA